MTRLRQQFASWTKLSWRERALLLEAAALLPLAPFLLKTLSFRKASSSALSHDLSQEEAERLGHQTARLVDAASSHGIFRRTCLHHAVVTWFLLRQQGVQCAVRIGVKGSDARAFEAHAWVELGGQRVGAAGRRADAYEAFDEAILPRDDRWLWRRP